MGVRSMKFNQGVAHIIFTVQESAQMIKRLILERKIYDKNNPRLYCGLGYRD